jgi:hypothetical protein
VVAAGVRQAWGACDLAAQRPGEAATRVDVAAGCDRGDRGGQHEGDQGGESDMLDARRAPLLVVWAHGSKLGTAAARVARRM